MRRQDSIDLETVTIAALLLGAVALRWNLIPALALALTIVLLVVSALRSFTVTRIRLILIANVGLWLSSGLLTGGIPATALFSPEFWTGDGRIFIYYLPLMALLLSRIGPQHVDAIIRFVKATAILGVGLLVVWVTTGAAWLKAETHPFFVGLQTSHTGAGTFWGAIALLLLVIGFRSRRVLTSLLGFAAIGIVFATASRQALVGLVAGLLWVAGRHRTTAAVGVLLVLVMLAPILGPLLGERVGELLSTEFLAELVLTGTDPSLGMTASGGLDTSVLVYFNVQMRLVLWRYAAHLFELSPLVGVGFGRFNDAALEFTGIPGLIYPAMGGVPQFSEQIEYVSGILVATGNAHNSYLHVLCENGIVGLGLLIGLWVALLRTLARKAKHVQRTEHRSFLEATQGLIIYNLVGAFFGHGLAAPSLGLLVCTTVGVAVQSRLPVQEPDVP